MAKKEITKAEFLAYEAVRRAGVTNMWEVATVAQLSGLDRETILAIMAHYGELAAKYLPLPCG